MPRKIRGKIILMNNKFSDKKLNLEIAEHDSNLGKKHLSFDILKSKLNSCFLEHTPDYIYKSEIIPQT